MSDVSVVIPNWNRAVLLKNAVRSALAQTVAPLEVLVCDDGSTDESCAMVESLGDDSIRWISGPRSGRPAVPRNRGVRESRGEWVAFLDSDDQWLPDKLERQLSAMQRCGCRAACSNAFRLVPGRGITGNYLALGMNRITFQELLRVNHVICSSSLIHRSLFTAVLGFPEDDQLRAVEDYALWLRVATQTDFSYVDEPLLVYRDDAANSIRNEVNDEWSRHRTVLRNFLRWGGGKGISPHYLGQARRQLTVDRMGSFAASLKAFGQTIMKALFR